MDVSQSIEEEMPDFLFCGTTTSKKFLAFPNICFDEGLHFSLLYELSILQLLATPKTNHYINLGCVCDYVCVRL